METRFYQAQGLDIERIAIDLERMFLIQGYQVQHFGDRNHTVVQFKKGGDFAAMVGMQAALTLTLEHGPGGVMAVIGQQKWADKAAAGAVGMLFLWPLAFTAGAGAIRQSNLTNQLLSALDSVVRQQNANVQANQIPMQMLPPQVQQQLAQSSPPPPPTPYAPQPLPPPPTPYVPQPLPPPPMPPPQLPASHVQVPASAPCPYCSMQNAADDTYCARCGKSLVPQTTQCPQCGTPIKLGAAFCTKCGAAFAPQRRVVESTVRVDMTPKTQVIASGAATTSVWGYLFLANGVQLELVGSRITIGRALPDSGDVQLDINLYHAPQSNTVSRMHAVIQRSQDDLTVTDLNSTNLTRINGLQLTPNVPVPLTDGDVCEFGHVKCTFIRI